MLRLGWSGLTTILNDSGGVFRPIFGNIQPARVFIVAKENWSATLQFADHYQWRCNNFNTDVALVRSTLYQ